MFLLGHTMAIAESMGAFALMALLLVLTGVMTYLMRSDPKVYTLSHRKVKVLQVNNKLIILDGHSPLRYVDLASNTVVQYQGLRNGR